MLLRCVRLEVQAASTAGPSQDTLAYGLDGAPRWCGREASRVSNVLNTQRCRRWSLGRSLEPSSPLRFRCG